MSNLEILRSAVVGLGQAGSRFDEEPRQAIWSHAGAYLSLPESFQLVAGVDPSRENRERFASRVTKAKTFNRVDCLQDMDINVVSVTTPIHVRREIFESIFKWKKLPKVIICEKPLAVRAEDRAKIVESCRSQGINLLVNYNRRYAEIYQRFITLLSERTIGELYTLTFRVPNRMWSVGSHAIDLLLYITGEFPQSWKSLEIPALHERDEPAVDFICTFPSGVAARVLMQAMSNVFIFELEAVGSKGRLTARENGKRLELEKYEISTKYLGYLEPLPEVRVFESSPNESTFVKIIQESAKLASGSTVANSTGHSAKFSEDLLEKIIKSRQSINHEHE